MGDPLNYANFVEWGFKGLLTGCFIYAVGIMKGVKESIDTLNLKVAVIVEKISHQEDALIRHEDRIRALEINDHNI